MLIENRINYLEEQNFDVEGSRKMYEQLFLENSKIEKSSESLKYYLPTVEANNFGSNSGSEEKCKHLMESKRLHIGQIKN